MSNIENFELGIAEDLPPPKTATWSEALPTLQLAWDSTSLGALKMCPQHYKLRIVDGWVSKGTSAHLTFGLIYHKALEVYDHSKALGSTHDQATIDAVRVCLTMTWDDELQRPWASDNTNKTRETLLRSVIWYLEKFAEDSLKTVILSNGKPAVELSFRFELGITSSICGSPYLMCGHIDRLVEFNDSFYVLDRKTTKYSLDQDYGSKYTPDNQMSLYDVAGQIILPEETSGFIIDAAQVLATISRFHRYPISRHKSVREEWLADLEYWLRMAEFFAQSNYWPRNDKACLSYWSHNDPINSGCPYRQVCSAAPVMRERILNSFYQKSRWDPLITRGEV